MIYDDDTRPHHHFTLYSENRPSESGRVRRPPLRVRRRIFELAARPGYGPERIYAYLRRVELFNVTVRDIRYVIAQGDLRQVDAPTQPG